MWYMHTMEYNLTIERNTDIGYIVDEPQNHFVKWKKPETKGHMCDSIYMNRPE